jgi:predicted transcriptional regulator
MTKTERQALQTDLVARYHQGASIRDLARQTGRSYGTVHRLLEPAGVLRKRGGQTKTPPTTPSPQP